MADSDPTFIPYIRKILGYLLSYMALSHGHCPSDKSLYVMKEFNVVLVLCLFEVKCIEPATHVTNIHDRRRGHMHITI